MELGCHCACDMQSSKALAGTPSLHKETAHHCLELVPFCVVVIVSNRRGRTIGTGIHIQNDGMPGRALVPAIKHRFDRPRAANGAWHRFPDDSLNIIVTGLGGRSRCNHRAGNQGGKAWSGRPSLRLPELRGWLRLRFQFLGGRADTGDRVRRTIECVRQLKSPKPVPSEIRQQRTHLFSKVHEFRTRDEDFTWRRTQGCGLRSALEPATVVAASSERMMRLP